MAYCPRCNSPMGQLDTVCPNCGYDFPDAGSGPRSSAGSSPTRWLRTAVLVLLALFLGPLFFAGFARPEWELGWSWTLRLIGALIGVVGGLELIRHAAHGGAPGRAVPWIIVVLTGVLIISQSGAVALGLGGMGVALIVRDMLPRRGPPPGHESGSGKTRLPEV
jgi:hypothetical protein